MASSVQPLLYINHSRQTCAASGAHFVLAPRTFDRHRERSREFHAIVQWYYALRMSHHLVELARHVVEIFTATAFHKHLGNAFDVAPGVAGTLRF